MHDMWYRIIIVFSILLPSPWAAPRGLDSFSQYEDKACRQFNPAPGHMRPSNGYSENDWEKNEFEKKREIFL